MGKVKNKLDVIQYSFRLNLNKPNHLKIHEMLQEAAEESYGGITRLVVELLEQYVENGAIAMAQPKDEPVYVTEERMALNNETLKKEIALDIMTRLAVNRPETVPVIYGDLPVSKNVKKVQEEMDELDPSAAEMALLYADLED